MKDTTPSANRMTSSLDRKAASLYDRAEILTAVRLLVGEGNVTELRALEATTATERYPATLSGYFDDPEKLAAAVAKIDRAKGIYIIPNVIDSALLARAGNRIRKTAKGESTQDSNIIKRRWILIDADAVRPSGISSTDTEHAAAIARCREVYNFLRARGWPDPVAGDSGNGGHLLYRIDLATDDRGLVQRCLMTLAHRFDDSVVKIDTAVFNPARIWKLYGTRACKGDDMPDRPHRMAGILSAPDVLKHVPPELLESLAAELPASDSAQQRCISPGHAGSLQPFDLEAFVVRHGLDVDGPEAWHGAQGAGRRWVFRTSPLCDHHDGAAFLLQHASGAITAGCHHNSCQGNWDWRTLRGRLEPSGNSYNTPATQLTDAVEAIQPATLEPASEWRPFPVTVLPEPLRRFVIDGSKAIGCDASYLAVPALVVCAGAIGNTRRIVLKRTWSEPPVLWAAIVGESGSMKTPSSKLTLRPVRELQHKALEEHPQRVIEWQQEMMHYEKALAEWKRQKGGGEPPEKPAEPQASEYLVADTTWEALAPILVRNPRGILLARDELNGWLGSFDRYAASGKGGADSANWLSTHSAEFVKINRKTGQPPIIYVPSAFVCIMGGIQPGVLQRAMSREHRDSGLLARLLLAQPPRKAKRWTEAEVSNQVEDDFATLLSALFDLRCELNAEGEPTPVPLPLMPDAKAQWVAFYNEHNAEAAELDGDLAAAWSKLEAYAPRLALVVALVADPYAQQIKPAAMEAGITLARWFAHEARRVYGDLAASESDKERQELLERIERKGGAMTSRELMRGSRRYSTADKADAALNALAKCGAGRWEPILASAVGGQPTRHFVLWPRADVDTTSRNTGVMGVVSASTLVDWPEPPAAEAAA